ncbi:MAG: Sua5/YciO/YrdC/YwlC family protein [Planctomycetota bacterium]
MPPEVLKLRELTGAQRQSARARAAAALRDGEFVVLPCETLYGVAARADLPAPRLAAFRTLTRGSENPTSPFTWHAPSSESVIEGLGIVDPLHARALRRLSPGPVRFVISLPPAALPAALARVQLPPRIADDGVGVHVRIPDEEFTRGVLEESGVAVVIDRLPKSMGDAVTAPGLVPGVAMVIDTGPTRLRKGSTSIRLGLDSGGRGFWEVIAAGALEPRIIERRIRRTVLFVCTGNTCRSPMAESIATHIASQRPRGIGGIPTVFASAGIAASEGEPTSSENVAALAALGVSQLPHHARGLTPTLAHEADVVYAMTKGHLRAVRAFAPSANVLLLDPGGSDIPDPVGSGAEVYAHTARLLDSFIRLRLGELESPIQPLAQAAEVTSTSTPPPGTSS